MFKLTMNNVNLNKLINIAFFTFVVINILMNILFGLEKGFEPAIGIFLIYLLNSVFFYLISMRFSPILIKYSEKKSQKIGVMILKSITFGLIILMFAGQIGWFQNFSQILKG